MLSKLLAYLKSGGDANFSSIARNLDIEVATVEMLMGQLIKMGYLEVLLPEEDNTENCTPTKCFACAKGKNCNTFLKAKYKLVNKKKKI